MPERREDEIRLAETRLAQGRALAASRFRPAEGRAFVGGVGFWRGFWARLTDWTSGDNTFSWTRLMADGETPVDPPVTGEFNAKEVNGVEGIPTDQSAGEGKGKVVWMWPAGYEGEGEERHAIYRFAYEGGDGCWARLKTEGSNAVYTARRLKLDAETDADPEAPDLENVKEVNGVEGVPVGGAGYGSVVWAWPASNDPAEWRFAYSLPEGDDTWTERQGNKIVHIGPGPYFAGAEGRTHASCWSPLVYAWDEEHHGLGWWYYGGGGYWLWYSPWGISDPYPPYDEWDSGVTYPIYDAVVYDGKTYCSLQNNNLNHQPDTSPTWWQEA